MSTSYIIRTCNSDFTSHNGFRWPALGEVVCPDFDAAKECGAGLFGFLNGCGKGWLAAWSGKPQWLLVAVPSDTIIDLGDKVKFPRGEVIFSSQDRLAVIAELEARKSLSLNLPVVGAKRISLKLGAILTTGDYGLTTTGDYGTSKSGYCGVSFSGDFGTSISGSLGSSISGRGGKSVTQNWGKSKAGMSGYLVFESAFAEVKDPVYSFLVDGKKVKADTFYRCHKGVLTEV
jgi:hypothetical protein